MFSLSLKEERVRYAFNINKKSESVKILVFQVLGRQSMTPCTKQNCSASRNIQCTCVCVCVHTCVRACVHTKTTKTFFPPYYACNV